MVNNHKPINDETSSGGFRPTPSTLREETLKLFGRTLNFIQIWLQLFKINCENLKKRFCKEMIELFQKIPVALPKPVYYRNNSKFFVDMYRW